MDCAKYHGTSIISQSLLGGLNMKWEELPGEINGFKIIADLGRKDGKTRKAIVICKVCKRKYEAQAYYLKDRKHCGCLRPKEIKCSYRKTYPRLLGIYKCMLNRCYSKKDKCFHLYGMKGIRMCDEWIENPDLFCKWSLENGYADNLSIDRKDNNKDYCPDNCKWSDAKTQARNRKGIKLTIEKAKLIRQESSFMTRKELAKKYNISSSIVNNVLSNRQWIE